MKRYFLCCTLLFIFPLFGCMPQERAAKKIDIEKMIASREPTYAFKSEYIFSKYKKNAVINGGDIWGTGLWEELSFVKRDERAKLYACDTWKITDFVFNGEKYLFLGHAKGWFGNIYRPVIYGGEKFKDLIKTFRLKEYCSEAVLFPITIREERFLIVYIKQRATSYTSALFILDEKFHEVYRENISGKVYKIGVFNNDKGEECFFIKNIDDSLEYRIYTIKP